MPSCVVEGEEFKSGVLSRVVEDEESRAVEDEGVVVAIHQSRAAKDEDVDVTFGVPSCVVEDEGSRVVEEEVFKSGVLQSGAPSRAVEDK